MFRHSFFYRKTYIIFENGVWGVAPMRVVSRRCRCVVQRLCATDFKRPCLVRAAAPHSPPFWERGQGDRDSKLEVYFKNRLFLQTESCDEMYVSPQLFLLLFLLSYITIRCRYTSVPDSQIRFSHILQKFFFIFGI